MSFPTAVPSVAAVPSDIHGLVELTGTSPVYAGLHHHDEAYPHHRHSFLEIAVVVAGTGTHEIDQVARQVYPGDVLTIPEGVGHGYRDCDALELFNVCIDSALLSRELSWIWTDPLLQCLLDSASPRAARLRDTPDGPIDLMRRLELEALPGREVSRAEAVAATLATLCRLTRASYPVAMELPSGQLGARAERRLRQEFAAPWTLPSLAASFHVSERHLTASFRARTGTSPMSFLGEVRLAEAARLLTETTLTVSTISGLVGIPDPNYFARRFRRYSGDTPRDYRQRFKPSAMASSAGSAMAVAPETVKWLIGCQPPIE